MSNIDITNIPIKVKEKCCILNENYTLKNTIQSQTAEIGRLLQERDQYKVLYEELLNLVYINTSNIVNTIFLSKNIIEK